ncbi:DUF3309 family protein [Legionella rubrilucens]|nr:DUF3309 family protein [Legionella rubrilucens]
MSILGLIILILLLAAVLPMWPYSAGWGYRPTGIVGLLLVVFIVVLLTRGTPL